MTDVNETETTVEEEVEAIVEEAKESFRLIDRIKNRDMRTVKLDLGYDEVNSEKLAGIDMALGSLRNIIEEGERNVAGAEPLKKIVTKLKRDLKKADATGEDVSDIQDQIDEAQRQIKEREGLSENIRPLREQLQKMEEAAEGVRAEVRANSLSVELRALPYAIARGSSRRARKALGITEKGIPEALEDDFTERNLIEIAYDQVVRYRDNRSGETGTKLDIEVIEALRDFLPLSQSGKFFSAVNDLQFKNAVSESAIAQADF